MPSKDVLNTQMIRSFPSQQGFRFTFRSFHKALAICCFFFWFVVAFTGVLYAILTQLGGFKRSSVKILMQIHQGSIIPGFQKYYTVLLGLSLMSQSVVGAFLVFKRFKGSSRAFFSFSSIRNSHASLSVIFMAFIFVTALSGMMYRFLKAWLHQFEQAGWWMDLHTGTLFYVPYPIWPLVVGMSLMFFVVTGMYLSPAWNAFLRRVRSNVNKKS